MDAENTPLDTPQTKEESFLRLFLQHERRLYAFIFALVHHASDADDILQETSSVLWRKLDEFEPGTDFAAWAFRVARFQVLDHLKKKSRTRLRESTVEAIADQFVDFAHSSDPRRDALDQCLGKLPGADRQLILQRYEPGATTQSIAEQTGRSVHMVYKTLNRIHSQLLDCVRRSLAAEGAT